MNILLLGSGGREHAYAWKLAQSPLCKKLLIAPGNAGTALHGKNLPIGVNDFTAIEQAVRSNDIDMIVVGPEDPLINGIYDHFQATRLPVIVIGPSQKGAELEGSKMLSKRFMKRHNIPTPDFKVYMNISNDGDGPRSFEEGLQFIRTMDKAFKYRVCKASGAAQGKGATVAKTQEELITVFTEMLRDRKFGKASDIVLLEEFVSGQEFSVTILTDGLKYKILPVAKDYKRSGEGDTGPNTGGMGNISPVPFVTEEVMKLVESDIIIPTILGLNHEGISYKGPLYIQCMLVGNKVFVIEYNCRMGDPETQVILPLLKNDLVELFSAVTNGTLGNQVIEIDERACAAVVVASAGYPGDYKKGEEISLPESVDEDTIIFHAGTILVEGKLVTNGGRVLAVTCFGQDVSTAAAKATAIAEEVTFEGKQLRRDIGKDVLVEATTS